MVIAPLLVYHTISYDKYDIIGLPLNGIIDERLKAFGGLQMGEAIETGGSGERSDSDAEKNIPFNLTENLPTASSDHNTPHRCAHASQFALIQNAAPTPA